MGISYFFEASLAIQIHIVAALVALCLGIWMFTRRKGDKAHRLGGKIFLVFMLMTATSAIFIRQINEGSFSWIHIFVPVTFIAAWEAVYYIRKGNIRHHKRAVSGMFFGALLIPGLLSMMPGRLMHVIIFGAPY